MNDSASVRRVLRVSVCATVFSLVVPAGTVFLVGCGDSPQDGAQVKSQEVEQKGIDNMKNFMNKQKDASKK